MLRLQDLNLSPEQEKGRGQVTTTCPFCSRKRQKTYIACLSVNLDKMIYKCHHCEASGKIMPEEKSLPSIVVGHDLPNNVIEWFSKRGITEGTLRMNGVYYENKRIAFPYYKDGQVVNVKYRTRNKLFSQTPGGERIFYGYDDIKAKDEIYIVEGEIDKLTFNEAGFYNVVSVPDGAPSPVSKNNESKFAFLQNCASVLENVKKIIIAVDTDAPGKKLQEELIRRLGIERCYTMDMDDCKDANELLNKHGIARFKICAITPIPCPLTGIYTVDSMSGNIDELIAKGLKKGHLTGWKSVSELYTVRPGEMSILTGIPSHGKSEFLDALLMNLATKYGWKTALCSPENLPIARHCVKLLEKYTGNSCAEIAPSVLADAKEFLGKHFSFVLPDEDSLTIDHILSLSKALLLRQGINGLVIDPWNELDHSRPKDINETEYISQTLTKIRRFARTNQIHVWLVAHPAKLHRRDDGTFPVPTPYDISGSAHWKNKADNILCVYRDFDTDCIDVHIQKIRFKEVGKVGQARLQYHKSSGRFTEVI